MQRRQAGFEEEARDVRDGWRKDGVDERAEKVD